MKKLFLTVLFLASSAPLFAQQGDCRFAVTFTGVGRQGTAASPGTTATAFPALSNPTGTPCVSWHVTYQSTNPAAVISLSFQGVNDVGLVPGSIFTTITPAGCGATNPCTLVTGSNPMLNGQSSYVAVTAYFPWVSLLMNTCTGCSVANPVLVRIEGFRAYNAVQSVAGSAIALVNGTSVLIGTADPCMFRAQNYFVINLSTNTQIVAGLASNNVYICQFFLAPVPAAANVNIVESSTSGNACATAPVGMMGGNTAALGANLAINGGFVLPWGSGRAWMRTATVGDAVCIFTSAQVDGVITWVQNNP